MSKFLRVMIYIAPVLCLSLLFLLFNVSNPVDIGPGGILVVFVLIYIMFASVFFIILHFGIGLVGRFVSARKTIEQRQWRVGVHKAYYTASALAFAPVILLAMQSVGQLQPRDVILVTFLELLTIFYIVKRTR